MGTKLGVCVSDALEIIGKIEDYNTSVRRWLDIITAFDYTLEYGKGSGYENAEFLSHLPEPTSDHDRRGSSSLTPVKDGDIFLIRACGIRTHSSPTPGVGLGRLVPRPDSDV